MKLEQTFFVGVQDVDSKKKITNKALIEMISNISMLHGVVAGQTSAEGVSTVSWIVISWKLKVYDRPQMFSTLRVQTWAQSYARVKANRDYIVYDEADRIIAKATAVWVPIDVKSGRFLRVTPEHMEPFDPEPDKQNFPEFSFPTLRKFELPVLQRQEITADRSMVDYNDHVHNSNYMDLADLVLPEDVYQTTFDDVMIIYKLEVCCGDRIALEYSENEGKHYVAVRSVPKGKLHALIVMSEPNGE